MFFKDGSLRPSQDPEGMVRRPQIVCRLRNSAGESVNRFFKVRDGLGLFFFLKPEKTFCLFERCELCMEKKDPIGFADLQPFSLKLPGCELSRRARNSVAETSMVDFDMKLVNLRLQDMLATHPPLGQIPKNKWTIRWTAGSYNNSFIYHSCSWSDDFSVMLPDCQWLRLHAVAVAARAVPRTRPEVKRQVQRLMVSIPVFFKGISTQWEDKKQLLTVIHSQAGWFLVQERVEEPKTNHQDVSLYTTSSQHLHRTFGRKELGGRCLRRSIDDNAIHPDESAKADGPFATAGASSNSSHVDRCGGQRSLLASCKSSNYTVLQLYRLYSKFQIQEANVAQF